MEQSTILYIYFGSKAFTPFLSFMVQYLIENKKFKNKEVYNILNPFFFLSSLFFFLSSFLLLEAMGGRAVLLFDVFLEIMVYILFLFMGERSFFLAILSCLLHGASTSLNSSFRYIISSSFSDQNKRRYVMKTNNMIKTVVGVFSAWIGQDIYILTGKNEINIFTSFLSFMVSIIVVFFFSDKDYVKSNDIRFLDNLLNPRKTYEIIKDSYTVETVMFSFMMVTEHLLYICLAFFAHNIFIERRNNSNENTSRLGYVCFLISKIFRFVSYIFIKLYGLFFIDVNIRSGISKNIIIHGYIDGFSKVVACSIGYGILNLNAVKDNQLPVICISGLIGLISLYLLSIDDSLMHSYIYYIICFLSTYITKDLVHGKLSENKCKNFIFCFNSFISSLVNISLSYFCVYTKAGIKTRFRCFFYISLVLTTVSLGLYLYNLTKSK